MRNRVVLAAMSLAFSACRSRDRDLPTVYREVAVPEERLRSEEGQAHGRELFLRYCAICHGSHADGAGLRRQALGAPPRDFTDAAWRARTSPRQVFYKISEGSHGTAMPAWKSLEEGDAWDLTAYILSVGERR
jgi:mono/diheme cytochrome c family protein